MGKQFIGNRKSVVILTGAGAAIPWNAPTTQKITQKICQDKTFATRTGQPLALWFLNKLQNFYHRDPECVNFETILNSIDWLCSFYSSQLRGGYSKFKVQLPAFFKSTDDLEDIIDFGRIYEVKNNLWFSKNERAKFYAGWNDIDYFFENVYKLYINLIIREIETYEHLCLEDAFNPLNIILNQFLDELAGKKKTVRTYTLNYDRVIPKISNIVFFEGFTPDNDGVLKYDNQKVLTDYNTNCFYNLHGSIHYEQDWPDHVKLEPEKAIYNFGSGSSSNNDQESRKLINSNIITGLNKSSRIMQNPFSQFYHTFYNDCLKADIVYIFGYSFSDIHINKAIMEGLKVNSKQIIMIAGFDIITGERNVDKFTKRMDFLCPAERDCELILDNSHGFYNICDKDALDRVFYFRKGFKSFLEWKIWKK
jgi:hypothetical protein